MHPYDILTLNNGTKLVFTPCPGTKEATLEDSIWTLGCQAGVTVPITMMPRDELEKFNALSLPEVCAEHEIKWFHLPVEDDEAPAQDFVDSFGKVKGELVSLCNTKTTIGIHCRGGSGRTGLMAAILMLESGEVWQEVIENIQELRPRSLKIPPHVEYLENTYQIKA